MPLILRVDVDKPYGRSSFMKKVMSKIREDYWFPAIYLFGYLDDLKQFLYFLSKVRIKAHIYFRKCTLPPISWLKESFLDGHKLGLHAENTRNIETFKKELEEVQSYFSSYKLNSFTKHGSGILKLGRYHHPPYEPLKYLNWAGILGIPYFFGNEEINELNDCVQMNQFYPRMFWIEMFNGKNAGCSFQRIVDVGREKNVVVISHPANFIANKEVENSIVKFISLARQHNVPWVTIE
jgi:hypothetical protein